MIGTKLAHYEITSHLGSGCMDILHCRSILEIGGAPGKEEGLTAFWSSLIMCCGDVEAHVMGNDS